MRTGHSELRQAAGALAVWGSPKASTYRGRARGRQPLRYRRARSRGWCSILQATLPPKQAAGAPWAADQWPLVAARSKLEVAGVDMPPMEAAVGPPGLRELEPARAV